MTHARPKTDPNMLLTATIDLLHPLSVTPHSKMPANPDALFTMGDGHGNFDKVLETIFALTHLFEIADEDRLTIAKYYSHVKNKGNYSDEELRSIKEIIYKKIKVNPKAVGAFIGIGDLVGDRGPNDIPTLWLIHRLVKEGVHVVIPFSNHDAGFILAYEQYLAAIKLDQDQLRKTDDALFKKKEELESMTRDLTARVNFIKSGRERDDAESLLEQLYAERDQIATKRGQIATQLNPTDYFRSNMGLEQARSLYGLRSSLLKGHITQAELIELIQAYKACSQLFTYSIARSVDEHGQAYSSGFTYYVHSSAGLRTLFAAAKQFGLVDYKIMFNKMGKLADFLDDLNPDFLAEKKAVLDQLIPDIETVAGLMESQPIPTEKLLTLKRIAMAWKYCLEDDSEEKTETPVLETLYEKLDWDQASSTVEAREIAVLHKALIRFKDSFEDLEKNGLHALIQRDFSTPEKLAELVDKINAIWEQHLEQNTVTSLYPEGKTDMDSRIRLSKTSYRDRDREEFPISYATWARFHHTPYNRRLRQVGHFSFEQVHGHDGDEESQGNVFNLDRDNLVGRVEYDYEQRPTGTTTLGNGCLLYSTQLPPRKGRLWLEAQDRIKKEQEEKAVQSSPPKARDHHKKVDSPKSIGAVVAPFGVFSSAPISPKSGRGKIADLIVASAMTVPSLF